MIVAGTAIFNAENPRDVIHFLRTQCDDAQTRIRAERKAAASVKPGEGPTEGEAAAAKQAMKDPNSAGMSQMSQPNTYFQAGISSGSDAPPAARMNATMGNK